MPVRTVILLSTSTNNIFEHLLFICRSFRLRGELRVEESVELICQSYQKGLP